MGDDPSETQAVLDKAQSPPSIRAEDTIRTDSLPVTTNNLEELERQQEMLWADAAKATNLRGEHTRRMREGAMSLGIDMTLPIYQDVEKSLVGMTPMERFVGGNNNH